MSVAEQVALQPPMFCLYSEKPRSAPITDHIATIDAHPLDVKAM